MRLLALLILAGACTAAEPEFSLAPQSFALSGKVDYVLGDARHPFVDDDNRRALLGLRLQVHGRVAVLGYSALAVERAVADTGEELRVTLPLDGAALDDHALRDDPSPTFCQVGLPPGKAPYRGLAELRGSVDIAYAITDAATWEIPFARLKADETDIAGREELGIAVVDDGDASHIGIRLAPEARLAVIDLQFRDAAGKAIAIKPPRADRRDAKPGKRKHQPVGGKDDVLLYNASLPEGATVVVHYYPTIEHRRLPFALAAVRFGVAVPDASSAAAAGGRGADDL
jgi:hypothetical protein